MGYLLYFNGFLKINNRILIFFSYSGLLGARDIKTMLIHELLIKFHDLIMQAPLDAQLDSCRLLIRSLALVKYLL